MTVLAAKEWKSNAELIEDVARLGYLKREDRVLDPTHGEGVWWKNWRPRELVTHDIKIDGVDFRQLPHEDGEFDAVAYDPPYVSVGGRATSGTKDFHERYGMDDAPTTPVELQELIDAGLTEAKRVTKTGGIILVKCADYISSGRIWPGTHYTFVHGFNQLRLDYVDRFEHIGRPRAQPSNRTRKCSRCDGKGAISDEVSAIGCTMCHATGRVTSDQQHARRNLSTLFVFRKGKV